MSKQIIIVCDACQTEIHAEDACEITVSRPGRPQERFDIGPECMDKLDVEAVVGVRDMEKMPPPRPRDPVMK